LLNIVNRLIQLIGVLFAISLLTFAMLNLLPGNAAENRIGPLPFFTPQEREEVVRNLYEQLGLDKPLPVQYALWMWHVLHGDFGLTVLSAPVGQVISQRLAPTLELGLTSVLIGVMGCLVLALWAYRSRSARVSSALQALMSTMLVVPGFWLGFLLILLLAVQLPFLPASGFVAFDQSPEENLRHMILPALTLGLPQTALYFRYLVAGLEEISFMPFVLAARAKGITERRVTYSHVLPNAALPTLTIVGMATGSLISGLVIVETVFAWPGLGSLMVQSVGTRDYNTLAAIVLLTATSFVVTSNVVDLAYWWLDPRTRRS
jgi:peptide/nickel transport system permease protein